MKLNQPCPVCESHFTLYVQDVIGRRTRSKISQYVCLDCRSFTNRGNYKEDDHQLKLDLSYLIDRQNHIAKIQDQLMKEIYCRLHGISSVCEIGCGTGLFLKAAQHLNLMGHGFELNPYAAEYAQNVIKVSCEVGLLSKCHQARYDLMAAIGVMEHLDRPRDLFREMMDHMNPDGAIYINVPFVEREHWRFLWDADRDIPDGPPNPFYDNDVHITHFSIGGLKKLGLSMGARRAEYFVSQDSATGSPGGAYPGVLFYF